LLFKQQCQTVPEITTFAEYASLQSSVGAFDSRGTITLDSQLVDLQKYLSHVQGFS